MNHIQLNTTVDLVQAVVNALLEDVNKHGMNFLEWCFDAFGKYPSLYVGFRNDKPPEYDPTDIMNSPFPLISIFHAETDMGETKDPVYTISIAYFVVNQDITTDDSHSMPVVTYEGFLQVEALRQQAEYAIIRGKLETALDPTGGFSFDESLHPLYKSYSVINPQGLRSYYEPQPSGG